MYAQLPSSKLIFFIKGNLAHRSSPCMRPLISVEKIWKNLTSVFTPKATIIVLGSNDFQKSVFSSHPISDLKGDGWMDSTKLLRNIIWLSTKRITKEPWICIYIYIFYFGWYPQTRMILILPPVHCHNMHPVRDLSCRVSHKVLIDMSNAILGDFTATKTIPVKQSWRICVNKPHGYSRDFQNFDKTKHNKTMRILWDRL